MRSGAGLAVTGLGVVCALGESVEPFAAGLLAGSSAITELPADSGGPRYGAPLAGFSLADAVAARTGLPDGIRRTATRVASRSPRPVQVALAAALEAWESACLHENRIPAHRIALVVAGHNLTSRHSHELAARFHASPAYVPPRFALQMLDTDHVGTLSHVLGVTGEGFTVGGASASGNVAIIAGSRLVESGAADACLVVGALAELSPVGLRALGNLGAMAWDVASVPFDESHAGFVAGEGAACLVLESAASARHRAVAVHALLTGYAQRLDANSLANPAEDGEVTVMVNALQRAGRKPREVGYVNAHGTGSPLGDRTEIRALRRVFGGQGQGPWVNSTKALVGHCLSAAGVVEAVATVVQLRDGFLHPNTGLRRPPSPGCRFVGQHAEQVRAGLALSNGFGFGGFNTCVALAAPGA